MGTYTEGSLISGETIKSQAKVTWLSQFWNIIFAVITFPFLLLTITNISSNSPNHSPSAVIGFVSALLILKSFINVYTTELAVTNKKIVGKTGFVRRTAIELPLQKLESMHISQGIIGRLLGFGNIIINGTGGNKVRIPYIKDPLSFRKATMSVVDEQANGTALRP